MPVELSVVIPIRNESPNIDALYAILGEELKCRTTAAWRALLDAADLPNGAVNDFNMMADDPYLTATGFFHHYEHPTEGAMVTTAIAAQFSATRSTLRKAR